MSKNSRPLSRPNGARPKGLGLRASARVAGLCLVLPSLGGCGMNKVYQSQEVAIDYKERHPVVVAEAPTTIDVFPRAIGGRLDEETHLRLREFVSLYRRFGQGRITVLAPYGGLDPRAARRDVELVRRELARDGFGAVVYVGGYPVKDMALAAPTRLSFVGVKAEVLGNCGEWPDDLASASSVDGWQNRTYWNFGCATQSTLASQIADPRDLVTPRGQTPQDVETRMRAILKQRTGG